MAVEAMVGATAVVAVEEDMAMEEGAVDTAEAAAGVMEAAEAGTGAGRTAWTRSEGCRRLTGAGCS